MNPEDLDSGQYSLESIADYETVWGQGFVSPGGMAMARELLKSLESHPGDLVLDVGSGLGGCAFLMAREFGLRVDGIDFSRNMTEIATARCSELGLQDAVTFRWGDCLQLEAESLYHAITSRDVFLHIHDKSRLFEKLFRALKPGGRLMFTDYCCSSPPWSDQFSAYLSGRGYCLHTVEEYEGFLSAANFVEIEACDVTQRFVETLTDDLKRLVKLDAAPALLKSWQAKLERTQRGEQRWGLFQASKSS